MKKKNLKRETNFFSHIEEWRPEVIHGQVEFLFFAFLEVEESRWDFFAESSLVMERKGLRLTRRKLVAVHPSGALQPAEC